MARRKFSDLETQSKNTQKSEKPTAKKNDRSSSRPASKNNNNRSKNSSRNRQKNDSREQKKDNAPKKRQKLSDHFSRKDFHCKSGLDTRSFKISAGLVGALEYLRSIADNRINIVKGFECNESAEKSGKLKRNYHVQGLAVNITIDNLSLEESFLLAETIPEFTGIGINYDENFLHVRAKKEKEHEYWIEKNKQVTLITSDNKQKLILDKVKTKADVIKEPESEPS